MKETFCGSMSSMDGVGTAVWSTPGLVAAGEVDLASPLLFRCGVAFVRPAAEEVGRPMGTAGDWRSTALEGVCWWTDPRCTSGTPASWAGFLLGAGERDAVMAGSPESFE